MMNFSEALKLMKEGRPMLRAGWNGKGMYVNIQVPTPKSKMTMMYLYMKTADGNLVPWLASQADLLSKDWDMYNGN